MIQIFENRHNPSEFTSSTECFRDFIAWCETQPDEYFPTHGVESMYSKIFLRELYTYLSALPNNQSDDNSPADALVSFFNSLLDQHGRPRCRYA
jgi:hypothetical protein